MATYLSVAKCIRNLYSNAKINIYDVAVTVTYASNDSAHDLKTFKQAG